MNVRVATVHSDVVHGFAAVATCKHGGYDIRCLTHERRPACTLLLPSA